MDPSALSKVMRGRRIPSEKTIRRWIDLLEVHKNDSDSLLKAAQVRSPRKKKCLDFQQLPSSDFDQNYEWYFPILLETSSIRILNSNPESVAKQLGIPLDDLKKAISTLMTLKLLKPHPKNATRLLRTHNTTSHLNVTSEKRRAIQKKYLELAATALDQIPFEERENSTLTISLSQKDLDQVKAILKRARQRVHRFAHKKEEKADRVFNLTMALYPVVKGKS